MHELFTYERKTESLLTKLGFNFGYCVVEIFFDRSPDSFGLQSFVQEIFARLLNLQRKELQNFLH